MPVRMTDPGAQIGRAAERGAFGRLGRFFLPAESKKVRPIGWAMLYPTEKPMNDRFILLIEDNADDAFLAKRVIGKVCSDTVIVARDGEEASELLHKMARDEAHSKIRLVLLDLKLPKISGIEVLATIRATPALCHLPVATLTSSDNDLDQERCRELGILDYIYKPITADRLSKLLSREQNA